MIGSLLHAKVSSWNEYDFPVFPDDFAYYLLKDNNTLVIMISAVKKFKG